ncbi:hypothetical protein Y1Q_0022700 [Alligator mississippiensis]|uniref:Uncharacterized protein n=1 Tax=Alligator mississippiensis TaxID=8496 RepID=A0A151MYC8_ALLMI|nr:hypothetical protein Y1Q_0022700 [Alligator mississippiensis]
MSTWDLQSLRDSHPAEAKVLLTVPYLSNRIQGNDSISLRLDTNDRRDLRVQPAGRGQQYKFRVQEHFRLIKWSAVKLQELDDHSFARCDLKEDMVMCSMAPLCTEIPMVFRSSLRFIDPHQLLATGWSQWV